MIEKCQAACIKKPFVQQEIVLGIRKLIIACNALYWCSWNKEMGVSSDLFVNSFMAIACACACTWVTVLDDRRLRTRLASHDTAETDLRDFEKAQHMLGETLLV